MKKYFITGLITALPLALTLMVIAFLFDFFTAPFITIVGPFIKLIQSKLPFVLPNNLTLFLSRFFALLFLSIFIFCLGVVTRLFVIKTLLSWGDKIMFRIPLIRSVYRVTREIFSALFSTDGKKAFKRPVMIPFPDKPNYCLGFIAGEVAKECQEKVKTKLVSVFAPTAPHPISGFFFLVSENDAKPVDMTNEEVIKFLVSCGMILPDSEMVAQDDQLF